MLESLPIRLPWSRAHMLGVSVMDEEHEMLAAALVDAQSAAPDELVSALLLLRGLWIDHQSHEEQMMRALSYPDLHSHAAEHARALAVLDLACESAQDPANRQAITALLRDAIPRWLNSHLSEADAAFAAWVTLSLSASFRVAVDQPAALT
jgi:hemerythrin-like metal-binding protein